jgi:hypothetical protein
MKTRRGSDTVIGKKIAGTAFVEYRVKFESCRKMIRGLEAALNQHKQEQTRDPMNWGWNGDLGRVEELLAEAIRAVNSGIR